MTGVVHGVGLGPGAADLMSVRSDRLIRGARHVAYFRKAGRKGRARATVEGMLREGAIEHPMEYPVTTEIPFGDPEYVATLSRFYETQADHLRALAQSGEEIAVLCEGDPFFYGSFMHLYTRLKDDVRVEVVPAITGMSGAWTATGAPVTWGDDCLSVLPATMPEEELTRRVRETDALVVMKIGTNFPKIRRALAAAGREADAWFVEYATMENERVRPLVEVDKAPYFSIIVVHGQGRRP